MAQQNSTPTLSKSNVSDQRFAAGHESSPKNDISLSDLLLARQRIRAMCDESSPCEEVEAKPMAVLMRLQHLKMFSRGQSPLQKDDVATLHRQQFDKKLKAQFPDMNQRTFHHHEIYDLLIGLNAFCAMGGWYVRENSQEMIVHTCYGSIFPGLRFKKQGETYRCVGFNFNIRLVS
ncbi:hypothetical protein VCHA38O209_100026 [Vibrio chagasii]|nr:hypothetical protein VCHA41O249_140147 [Vibrio chagasii]CAH7135469.1 hypothetical protein VCHA38O209_100026 [Vibrio chagasii]